jgi:pimeloyl-ACP methyl ester carboxylesterase
MVSPVKYATTSDGMSIAYWTVGSGPTLIFMPEPVLKAAAPEFELPSPSQWYERLSRHRRIVRFDHRGSGMSSREVTDYSLAAFELDLATIVEATGGGPVDLWAQEDAGPIAISFAVHRQELVSHLILWDSFSRAADIPTSPALHTLEGFVATNWPMFMESNVRMVWRWDGGEADEYIAALKRSVPAESGRAFLDSAWNWDVTPELRSLAVPTLVLQRRDQPIFGLDLSTKLAARIPNAQMVVVEGDSQFPWVGDSEPCARAFEEFVGESSQTRPKGKATPAVSEVGYARSGDVNIAYRVAGEGPFDIVFVPGSGSHVELAWEVPVLRVWFESFASYARLIHFDKRGTGMSDAVSPATPLETRMDDVRAVMDAAGSEKAAVVGVSEGGPMSALFAATYPDRTWALVLYGSLARVLRAPDYPWGADEAEELDAISNITADVGNRGERLLTNARNACPNGDDEEIAALAKYFQNALTPGAAQALAQMNLGIDIRHVLPAIRVPTLVLHNAVDAWVPVGNGRYLAQQIPGAQYVEFHAEGHIPSASTSGPILDETERFLRRAWEAGAVDESADPDRVLATVLFTDIVGSSEHAATLGDRAWRETLQRHHELVRRQLLRHRGVEVDTAGDGFFASFDGPARAIRCACAITDSIRELGIEVRAGLHTGECELVEGKVAGIAVHTGARVASRAQPGEVLVSSTVRDLVAGSGIQFADRGVAELKGIPGDWRLYAVENAP